MSVTTGGRTKVMPFSVRPLRTDDISQSERIEREAFPSMFPPTAFRRELNNRLARYLVAWRLNEATTTASTSTVTPGHASKKVHARALVGRLLYRVRSVWNGGSAGLEEYRDLIAGFVGIWYMVEEAHIVSVGVRKQLRGHGIGELLLVAAIEQAMARRAEVVTLEVRPSNTIATNLYRKYGFEECGMRKGYYTDNREDALIMSTVPIRLPSFQGLFQELKQEHRCRWGHRYHATRRFFRTVRPGPVRPQGNRTGSERFSNSDGGSI